MRIAILEDDLLQLDMLSQVVSAMGQNTDLLVDLAQQVNRRPPAREMDMLLSTGEQVSVALMAMAIDALGYKAMSLTGGQIGIVTAKQSIALRAANQRVRTCNPPKNIQPFVSIEQVVAASAIQYIVAQHAPQAIVLRRAEQMVPPAAFRRAGNDDVAVLVILVYWR